MIDPDLCLELLRSTLDGYNRLSTGDRDGNWPELTLVAVAIARERLSAAQAWGKLNDAAETQGVQGWVRYRSAWRTFGRGEGKLPAVDQIEVGPPIAAEWSEGGGVGWQLRPWSEPGEPASGFGLWRYEERDLAVGDAPRQGGRAVLRQRLWVLEHPAPDKLANGQRIACLAYHVFWGADKDDPSALRRLSARFAGFEQREDRYVEARRRGQGRG